MDEVLCFLTNIIDTYKGLLECLNVTNLMVSDLANSNYSKNELTSCVLIKNIYAKWFVETFRRGVVCDFESLRNIDAVFSGCMVIYSNNADSVLEKLSQAVKLITNCNSEEIFDNLNFQKIVIQNNLFAHQILFHMRLLLLIKNT